ncbi:hypothetical protein [Vibrio splendidus]|jgi:hypothetical protein|uniref:hypothetical protein n=1 Tax=Vibrio splendidus TaxID=29497 RepID=UPI00080EBFA0|nr:hypothetical protein [Vibrio splendidus]OCH66389.1 hypothetical protein A6D94_23625 [Vibrio splendidus]
MNIDKLLGGANPTSEEYVDFCYVCEELPYQQLWQMITEYPLLHPFLKTTATQHMRDKVALINKERLNSKLVQEFQNRISEPRK